ncbi:clan AA aspartic protease [Candidatus Poribacteria bacterium]|nr:clan AA aspartic protease [Candidatus Poribacteria bacterium]
MGRFSVEFKLANSIDAGLVRRGLLTPEQVRQVKIRGVVDTGATRLVIPAKVSEQLGAREVSDTQVRYADNRTVTRKLVDDVQVELLGRQGTFRAVVEPGRDSALIGAIVLEDLDFVVDRTTQTLRPRDPKQIISEIE